MKTIEAIIERASDGTFSVFCKDEKFSGLGETAEAAKQNMMDQMKYFKESAKIDGFEYPAFLDEEFEIVYTFDTQSLLGYYFGILSLAGLEKLTGINRKQLWSYSSGRSKPRPAQAKKIEHALHNLGKELTSITL